MTTEEVLLSLSTYIDSGDDAEFEPEFLDPHGRSCRVLSIIYLLDREEA